MTGDETRINAPEKFSPKVSVIVPVYRGEETLQRCLDSLLGQSLDQIEVIVVDDGSPGKLDQLMAGYLAADHRVRVIRHEDNRGVYAARITGSRQARGEYLVHMDCDDYAEPDMMLEMHRHARAGNFDIVECNAKEIPLQGGDFQLCDHYEHQQLYAPQLQDAFFTGKIQPTLWNKLIRKSLWDESAGSRQVDRRLCNREDLLITADVFKQASSYMYLPQVHYIHPRRSGSLSHCSAEKGSHNPVGDILYVLKTMLQDDAMGIREIPERLDHVLSVAALDIEWCARHLPQLQDWPTERMDSLEDQDLLTEIIRRQVLQKPKVAHDLLAQLTATEHSLHTIRSSRIWRSTAPLRSLLDRWWT